MITLKELEDRHAKELAEFYVERDKRFIVLEQQQRELLDGVICTHPKARSLLQDLMQDQRKAWNAAQKDELDLLTHSHSYERDSFIEKEAKRNQLAEQIANKKDHSADRDR